MSTVSASLAKIAAGRCQVRWEGQARRQMARDDSRQQGMTADSSGDSSPIVLTKVAGRYLWVFPRAAFRGLCRPN